MSKINRYGLAVLVAWLGCTIVFGVTNTWIAWISWWTMFLSGIVAHNTKRCEKGGIMFAYTKVYLLAAHILLGSNI